MRIIRFFPLILPFSRLDDFFIDIFLLLYRIPLFDAIQYVYCTLCTVVIYFKHFVDNKNILVVTTQTKSYKKNIYLYLHCAIRIK